VVAFSKKFFLDRILTCWNLAIRNVVSPDVPISCVMCGGGVETSTHLFLPLMEVDKVLDKVLKWLDLTSPLNENILLQERKGS